jgi:hypothetical protein
MATANPARATGFGRVLFGQGIENCEEFWETAVACHREMAERADRHTGRIEQTRGNMAASNIEHQDLFLAVVGQEFLAEPVYSIPLTFTQALQIKTGPAQIELPVLAD